MELMPAAATRTDAQPLEPVEGRAVLVLAWIAYLGVALSHAFLDRSYGHFVGHTIMWAGWSALGFGIRLVAPGRPVLRRRIGIGMTVLVGLVTVMMVLGSPNLVRVGAQALLYLIPARVVVLQTRRDLYYLLAVLVAIALSVITHNRAQWPIWFYLGPAWLAIGLVLAWDYAARLQVAAWIKVASTAAFAGLCVAVMLVVISLVPRPYILGFGFLPPGTTHPGMHRTEGAGPQPRESSSDPAAANQGQGQGGGSGGERRDPGPGASSPGGWVLGVREALQDKHLPQWQRTVIETALRMAEGFDPQAPPAAADRSTSGERGTAKDGAGFAQGEGKSVDAEDGWGRASGPFRILWLLLALGLFLLLLWLRRWRIATSAALGAAWLLTRANARASMRCSMQALRWLLRWRGHPLLPGQSLAEQVAGASRVPAVVRGWLGDAVRAYGGWRFGAIPAHPRLAMQLRQRVLAADEALRRH